MSIEVYIEELDKLREQVHKKLSSETILGSIDFSKEEKQLEELLEDLTDFSRTKFNQPLVEKLAGLQVESQSHYNYRDGAHIEARILRIQRVVRTFGSDIIDEARGVLNQQTSISQPDQAPSKTKTDMSKVFIVHGHDDSALYQVKDVISQLDLKPIVLREQPNQGRTIIEKFEANSDVGFAIVLMTKDDMGASLESAEAGKYRPRARQNVILELGYFSAKLGRSLTCVLKESGVEEPSDILGVVYTEIDSAGAWKLVLGKELRAAGYSVDLNKL